VSQGVSARAGQICRRSRDGTIVTVRLTPKSACDEISGTGIYNGMGVLKAKVRAIPDKGKANMALEKLIAKWLRVPASTVSLASGGKSRLKSIGIYGDSSELLNLVGIRLASVMQK